MNEPKTFEIINKRYIPLFVETVVTTCFLAGLLYTKRKYDKPLNAMIKCNVCQLNNLLISIYTLNTPLKFTHNVNLNFIPTRWSDR